MKKHYLVFVLSIFLSQTLFSASPGDVNSNSAIDIVDALLAAQYCVGITPAVFDTSVADVNCCGSIDIVDALLVAQYYVGLISAFPCATSQATVEPTLAPAIEPTTGPTSGPATPDPTEPPWGVKVQYKCGETAASAPTRQTDSAARTTLLSGTIYSRTATPPECFSCTT